MSKLKCAESSSDNLCITGSKSFSVKKKKKKFSIHVRKII